MQPWEAMRDFSCVLIPSVALAINLALATFSLINRQASPTKGLVAIFPISRVVVAIRDVRLTCYASSYGWAS